MTTRPLIGLAAIVAMLSLGCALKRQEVIIERPPDSPPGKKMPLVFHDPLIGGCKLHGKPLPITASKGEQSGGRPERITWEVDNQCEETLEVCLVGFLPTKESPATTPDPLLDVNENETPIERRRCTTANPRQKGHIRTRVADDAVIDRYEYHIEVRREGQWKRADPMIEIVR
jgi:hypothetical protein